jgi:hypothetical protein
MTVSEETEPGSDFPVELSVEALTPFVNRMDEMDLCYLLVAVLKQVNHSEDPVIAMLAIEAVRAWDRSRTPAHRAATRTSGMAAYSKWRGAQDRPGEWLSAKQIKRACGKGWYSALHLAGIEIPAGVRMTRLRDRPGYSREQLQASIAIWVKDTGNEYLTFDEYRAWAYDRVTTTDEIHALSIEPFCRLFRTWRDAVQSVTGQVEWGTRFTGSGRTRFAGFARTYTNDEMIEALLDAISDTGSGLKLRSDEYATWAREQIAADDRPRPSVSLFQRRFGGWSKAILLATGEPGDRRFVDHEEIVRSVRLAAEETKLGLELTITEYAMWRKTYPRPDGRGHTSHTTIHKRYGTWEALMRVAFPEVQEPEWACAQARIREKHRETLKRSWPQERRWTDERIEGELRQVIDTNGGVWVSLLTLKKLGHSHLAAAITRCGGVAHWAERMGVDHPQARGPVPWSDERIRETLTVVMHGREDWPTRSEFEELGLGGLHCVLGQRRTTHYWAGQFGVPGPRLGRRRHTGPLQPLTSR